MIKKMICVLAVLMSAAGVGLVVANGIAGGASALATTSLSPAMQKQLSSASQTFTDIGTFGGADGYPSAVNDFGEIAGYTNVGYQDTEAITWTPSHGTVDLGTLGGTQSEAFGINDFGEVVGGSMTASSPVGEFDAFAWTPRGGMIDLGTLGGTDFKFYDTRAFAINNLGEIVGQSVTVEGNENAVLWTPAGKTIDLGTLGGDYSQATGINDFGEVVGDSTLPNGDHHAFLWTAQKGMVDLGTLGGSTSGATGINDIGEITGTSQTSIYNSDLGADESHAFYWTARSGMVDLGTLGVTGANSIGASGINDQGEVVGSVQSENDGVFLNQPFAWSPHGGSTILPAYQSDLGSSNNGTGLVQTDEIAQATALNNFGEVVGFGTLPTFTQDAIVWRIP